MNFIDILVLLIAIFQLIMGYRRGLILSAFGFASNFVAFLVTYIYQDNFKKILISMTNLDKHISKIVLDKIMASGSFSDALINQPKFDGLKDLPLPDSLKQEISRLWTQGTSTAAVELTNIITDIALSILSGLILYFVLVNLIRILGRVLNIISKLPIINSFNKLGGLLFSVGILYFWFVIIASILISVATLTKNPMLLDAIAHSQYMKFMVNNKFFVAFF